MIRLIETRLSSYRIAAVLMVTALLSGCASVYVDGAIKEVPPSQFTRPAKPAPVQLLFEFQTKGVANAQATNLLRSKVMDHVKESGLFASVSDQPAAGAALLSITLNNVPVNDDAFSKGFVTGLTFGLAGSQVSDGYVCTARLMPASGGAALTVSARHAIHTTVGNAAAPSNATKAANVDEAVFTMTRQILSQVMHDLSKNPSFNR